MGELVTHLFCRNPGQESSKVQTKLDVGQACLWSDDLLLESRSPGACIVLAVQPQKPNSSRQTVETCNYGNAFCVFIYNLGVPDLCGSGPPSISLDVQEREKGQPAIQKSNRLCGKPRTDIAQHSTACTTYSMYYCGGALSRTRPPATVVKMRMPTQQLDRLEA